MPTSKLKSKLCNELISKGLVKPYYVIAHNYTDGGERDKNKLIQSKDNIFPTQTAQVNMTAKKEQENMRIRKITPKEAMRLMAFQDTDTNSMKISESGIYHCAGDSICVNVLISLFAQLLDIDNVEITKKYIEEIKNVN